MEGQITYIRFVWASWLILGINQSYSRQQGCQQERRELKYERRSFHGNLTRPLSLSVRCDIFLFFLWLNKSVLFLLPCLWFGGKNFYVILGISINVFPNTFQESRYPWCVYIHMWMLTRKVSGITEKGILHCYIKLCCLFKHTCIFLREIHSYKNAVEHVTEIFVWNVPVIWDERKLCYM